MAKKTANYSAAQEIIALLTKAKDVSDSYVANMLAVAIKKLIAFDNDMWEQAELLAKEFEN